MAQVDPAWAWAPFAPSSERPWTLALAAHLMRRAGLGAGWTELQQALQRGPRATVDALLVAGESAHAFNAEHDTHESAAARSSDAAALNAWWLRRLVTTPDPLGERLVLFWHNHFAIRSDAVADLRLFHQHLQLLRAQVWSDFDTRLGALFSDPAMFVALGGEQNRRSRPNQAFARPWLEAFTVGADAATERDVAELARGLTGWFVIGGKLRFLEREHDAGEKHLLGHTGTLAREQLAPILADHPAAARNLARSLVRAFVSEAATAPELLLEPLAAELRKRDGFRSAIGTILRSNLFFSEHALHQRIKSPLELAVGLARSLGTLPPTVPMAGDLARLGQRLDAPPTVRGWSGGVDWVNSITAVWRLELARSMVEGTRGYGEPVDPVSVAGQHGVADPEAAARFWMEVLLPGQLSPAARQRILALATGPAPAGDRLRQVVSALVSQPEFQLN